jgi:hypothetical protein
MRPRFSRLIALIGISIFALTSPPIHASTINFLFTSSGDGNPGDTVSGELFGLQNGTNEDPTEITITQAPASLGLNASVSNPYILNVTSYLTTNSSGILTSNTTGVYGFTVTLTGGVETIAAPLDVAFENSGGNGVGFNFYSTFLNGPGYNGALFTGNNDYSQTGFAGTTFTPVPEPRAWPFAVLTGGVLLILARKFKPSVRLKLIPIKAYSQIGRP